MFLAVRELLFAKGRFVLMGSVVALITILMVLLSGLSVGLVNDGVSGLQRMPATSFAFQDEVSKDSAFSRSVVTKDAVRTWADQPGVDDAAPLGNALVNAESTDGVEIDLALLGIETDSYLAPEVASGRPLGDALDEVVVSGTAAEEGIEVGDVIVVEPMGTELTVVGMLADQHTFGHVDIGYLPLRTWQEIRTGARAGDEVPDRVYDEITAVAVRGGDDLDLGAGDEAAGTTSLTLEESFGASPGYTAETSTLQLVQGFLYAISALVVGAFFTVLTIQRRPEVAVMRAMGASTGYLLRDSLVQSFLLLLGSVGVGLGLGLAAGAGLSSTPMPFALEAGPIAFATVLLLLLGMVGAAIAVLRITRVDPLTARDQLRLPLTFGKVGDPRDPDELLAEVGMAHKAKRRPHQLSGGERQRIGIARALVTRPAVLLVDEPTAALDRQRSQEVVALLAEESHRHGVATVMVTHDHDVLHHCDEIYEMIDGRLSRMVTARA